MVDDVEWSRAHPTLEGPERRGFVLHTPGGRVPGTVWTPPHPAGPLPLVLLGHGGSGHRHSERIVSLAGAFTASGCAAAAVDGPFHGERVPAPLDPAVYQARMAAEGIGAVLDRVSGEWLAVREALARAGIAEPGRVAYLGLSLGTRLGLAPAAALGPDLRCAVFGKFGTEAAPAFHPGLHAPHRARDDAAGITAPVLFHLQLGDELFSRRGQLDLFDAFPNPRKALLACAGGHRRTPDHAPALWHAFVARHLAR